MNYNLDYIDRLAKDKLTDFKLEPEYSWTDFSKEYASKKSEYSAFSNHQIIRFLQSKPLSIAAFFGALSLLVAYFVQPYSVTFSTEPSPKNPSTDTRLSELPYKILYAFIYAEEESQTDNTGQTLGVDTEETQSGKTMIVSDTSQRTVVVRKTVYVRDTLKITDTVKIYNSGQDSVQLEKRSEKPGEDNKPGDK